MFDEKDDEQSEAPEAGSEKITHEEYVVAVSAGGRKQIKMQVTRSAGNLRKIEIQRVPTDENSTEMQSILKLDREEAARLVLIAKTLDYIPVEGEEDTSRVDDQLLRDLFSDPSALEGIYHRDRGKIRRFIEEDPSASDVLALAHRRTVVEHFRSLLTEPDYFESFVVPGRGPEGVWQSFLEENPWILGIGGSSGYGVQVRA